MIELENMTEDDWIWAYNMDAYRDESIMAFTLSSKLVAKGNPYEPQSANWYRWEKGIRERNATLSGVGNLDLLKGDHK
jgi:hypothetical protein